jgi:glycosyltransferase involved in cell wall biosynthesis
VPDTAFVPLRFRRRSSLRVALLAPLSIPVPPKHYGGIERMVDLLAHGLVDAGVEVDVFANADSHTAGRLRPWNGTSVWMNALAVAARGAGRSFDIVNCFGPAKLAVPTLTLGQPTLLSFHSPISRDTMTIAARLGRKKVFFSAVSDAMRPGTFGSDHWRTIYNGIDTDLYRFQRHVDGEAPFVFLGRMDPDKGPHVAIQIASRLGRRLILAGNLDPSHRAFFDREIRPHLGGASVSYIGPVTDAEKNILLGSAKAILCPINWDEPFGLVAIEAMACGTPVIAFRRAAFPEIISDGTTGILGDDLDELCKRAPLLESIDRASVRQAVESRFGASVMTRSHLDYYEHIVRSTRKAGLKPSSPNRTSE